MSFQKQIYLSIILSILSFYISNTALASSPNSSPPQLSKKNASVLETSEKLSFPTILSGINLVSGEIKTIDLSKVKKAAALVFVSARCPCSASHQPTINQLANDFEQDGIEFIGIHSNANEELEFSKNYFKNSGLKVPVIHDPESKIADYFGALKTPHVFLVSPQLKVLFQGGIDNSKLTHSATEHYLKDALLAIRDGKEPREKSVRVLGCEIKRP